MSYTKHLPDIVRWKPSLFCLLLYCLIGHACHDFQQCVTVSYESMPKHADCEQCSTEATDLGANCKACLRSKFRKQMC